MKRFASWVLILLSLSSCQSIKEFDTWASAGLNGAPSNLDQSIRQHSFGKLCHTTQFADGGEDSLDTIIYGDLNADGREEAVVLNRYYSGGGNYVSWWIDVYELKNNRVVKWPDAKTKQPGYSGIDGGYKMYMGLINFRIACDETCFLAVKSFEYENINDVWYATQNGVFQEIIDFPEKRSGWVKPELEGYVNYCPNGYTKSKGKRKK